MADQPIIQTIDHGAVRELRLNRPPVNALSPELIATLKNSIEGAPGSGARALILSGSPGRFSGGLDVPLLLGLDRPGMAALWRDFYGLLGAIAKSPIPIAAAITGHAPAGGTVLALYCDWRVMAEGDYRIGLNEAQVGIPIPPVIWSGARRLLGIRLAERLAVSGELITSREALTVGLVDELVPLEQVMERAMAWCERLLALPPQAMAGTRRLARADLVAVFEADLELELESVVAAWWSAETQATLRALVEWLGKKTK
ncbi:MAG TPA: enoyl-CoA hydratase/isomerase family protein [Terriglobales bacterium]|nr:enoyl-CoA hydratase/isomerase family protein [Terriglobales bacterium]